VAGVAVAGGTEASGEAAGAAVTVGTEGFGGVGFARQPLAQRRRQSQRMILRVCLGIYTPSPLAYGIGG